MMALRNSAGSRDTAALGCVSLAVVMDRARATSHKEHDRMDRTPFDLGTLFRLRWVVLSLALATAVALGCATPLCAQTTGQQTFASPEESLQALVSAATAKDRAALRKLFGSDYDKLLSGDQVEDDKDLGDFSQAVQESATLQKDSDAKYTVLVGHENWPTPIPIVQKDGKWFFDTKAGIEEVLNRHIGENELAAIQTCRAYAVAQWEYFTEADPDSNGVAQYAQHFVSSSGKHDGLFWETNEGQKPSPLGQLVAAARAEGYTPGQQAANPDSKGGGAENQEPVKRHRPYHGYYYKILTKQGPHAAGGKYSYIINGNMIAGYALVAYPDKWGSSGVMTFIINQRGRVYEKNLGPNTAKIAGAITEYDPDTTWKVVDQQ
jgi:Protein of unknown function (DUF2950)